MQLFQKAKDQLTIEIVNEIVARFLNPRLAEEDFHTLDDHTYIETCKTFFDVVVVRIRYCLKLLRRNNDEATMEALAILEAIDHPLTIGVKMKCLAHLGTDEALNKLGQLVKTFDEDDFIWPDKDSYDALELEGFIHVLENSAFYYYKTDDLAKSLRLLHSAIELAHWLDLKRRVKSLKNNMGAIEKMLGDTVVINDIDLIEDVDAYQRAHTAAEKTETFLLSDDVEAAEIAYRAGLISARDLKLVKAVERLHNASAAVAQTLIDEISFHELPEIMLYRALLNIEVFAKTNNTHIINPQRTIDALYWAMDKGLFSSIKHAKRLFPLGLVLASHLPDSQMLAVDARQVAVLYDEVNKDGLWRGRRHERIATVPPKTRKAIIDDDLEGLGERDRFSALSSLSAHSLSRYRKYLREAEPEVKPYEHTSITAILLGLKRLEMELPATYRRSLRDALSAWNLSTRKSYLKIN